jgi:hypothetical protein
MKMAIMIFSIPSFNESSLTLEKKIPTNTTGIMLQDLIIITIGKLVILIAKILDSADTVTRIEQISIFFVGNRVEG